MYRFEMQPKHREPCEHTLCGSHHSNGLNKLQLSGLNLPFFAHLLLDVGEVVSILFAKEHDSGATHVDAHVIPCV